MAKPIIAYAIVRSVYSSSLEIIGVTSVHGRRVYGRDKDDASTNRAKRDVLARYETLHEAAVALKRVEIVRTAMAPSVDDADRRAYKLRETYRRAQERAAKPISDTVKIEGRTVRRFIPYGHTVDDDTVRCIGCGQIDEDGFHDMDLHTVVVAGALEPEVNA